MSDFSNRITGWPDRGVRGGLASAVAILAAASPRRRGRVSRSYPLVVVVSWLAAALAMPAMGETILLIDNFNVFNENATTFNNDNAVTQGGTLATVNYTVAATNPTYVAQHGNGGTAMLVANRFDTGQADGYGNVSLNQNFASNANAVDQLLRISFTIEEVSNFADPTRWVQFNVANAQNSLITDSGAGLGVLFRKNFGGQILSGGTTSLGVFTWSPGDLVTVTLSNTAGTGSAFNGAGSLATVQVGSTTVGAFTISQQTTAYANFSAFSPDNSQFGTGRFDNLTVALVPEPASLAFVGIGGLLAATALRRRRAA